MDRHWKTKWLKALRSGRYKQASGKLFKKQGKNRSYCCLGVLARLQGACFVPEYEGSDVFYPKIGDKIIADPNYLTRGMTVGLRKSQQTTLSQLNDSGKSFKEIADYIEKKIKGVVKKKAKKKKK